MCNMKDFVLNVKICRTNVKNLLLVLIEKQDLVRFSQAMKILLQLSCKWLYKSFSAYGFNAFLEYFNV